MRKYMVFAILGTLLMIVLAGCGEDRLILEEEQQNQMRVTGSATIKKAPDIAVAQIGVVTYNEELDAAIAENNRKSDAAIQALSNNGVEDKDMQTVSFNIYPQTDYQRVKPEIIGYQVVNTLSVTIRNLDSVGKALQGAIDAGANNIYGINFSLSDPEPIRNEARTKAIQDARQRAESMAEAAGIKLGKIININELTSPGPVTWYSKYDTASAETGVPIQTGELSITVQVELIYELP